MQDFLWQIKDTDSFTFFTTAAFVAAVFWFIREIVGAPMLALTGVPFLMLGGLASPIVFRSQMIALSFDEVIVTTFTAGQQATLPIWMLEELIRPRERPVTNVVAMLVVLVTFLPILGAYYLTREGAETAGSGK